VLRILTGAPLPEGVDTIALQEDATVEDGLLTLRAIPKRGANARAAGEDVAEGAPILSEGRRLTPGDLALAAAAGHGALPVRLPLRVGVLSTGDELIAPGADGEGTCDANRPMLLAMLTGWGLEAIDLGHAPDDPAALRAALDDAEVDAILTSGGASAGDEDHMSRLLRAEGTVHHWRIAIKPGRPLMLGGWKGMALFGLPGNPVAAFTCAALFARPALLQMAGAAWSEPETVVLPAAFEKRKRLGRTEIYRARLRDGRVELFASEGSGRTSGLSWAEGFVVLPEPAVEISEGDPVPYLAFSALGLA
jgi:molybdopterin molybdotransferase